MLQWRGLKEHRGEGNRAVVVSVANYDPGVELGRRPGAARDAKRLHRTLSKLGFKVDIHSDLSSDEIHQLFLKGNTQHTHSAQDACSVCTQHYSNHHKHLLCI